jgi:hypothetical protein
MVQIMAATFSLVIYAALLGFFWNNLGSPRPVDVAVGPPFVQTVDAKPLPNQQMPE